MISIMASHLESEVKNPVRGSHRNGVGYVNDSKSSGSLKSVLLRCEKIRFCSIILFIVRAISFLALLA